jgi:DNA-binding PadR family transcriptional regulator
VVERDTVEFQSGGGEMERHTPLTEALFYILLSVHRPSHGYGIIQKVEELTEGRVVLGPGTLYGAIQTMSAKGWIRIYSEETDSRKKKEYIITESGRHVFKEEKKRLMELLRNAEKMEEGTW